MIVPLIHPDFQRLRSVFPLTSYNIKFVQRGFTESTAFEERIVRDGRGLLTVVRTHGRKNVRSGSLNNSILGNFRECLRVTERN